MVVLYTIDCPKCKVLENLLNRNNVKYVTVTDLSVMIDKGFKECPKLEVEGKFYGFTDAVKLLKEGKVA